MVPRIVRPVLLLAATAALGACSSYGGYGTGVSVGYSTGGYYPYGSSYSRYPYYGWYDGFYYPGTGYYIYDSYGQRHRWNDRHRSYWEGRRGGRNARDNWSGYRRDDRRADNRDQRRWDNRDERRDYSRQRDERRDRDRGERRGNNDRQDWQRGSTRQAPVATARPQVQREAPRVERGERAGRRVDRGAEFRRGSRDNRRDDD